MEHLGFNLLFNTACSFFAGCLVIVFAIWLFRIGDSRWKLYFLSLPFIKILWDLSVGVPKDSVIFSGIDLFSLPPRSQTLEIGAGMSQFGPLLNIMFTAHPPSGSTYTVSLADYLYLGLQQGIGAASPRICLAIAVGVALVLVLRRGFAWWRFEYRRLKARASAQTLENRKVGFRVVDVYVCSHHSGTPFTGGLLRAYICVPKDAADLLNPCEFAAVIEHELAHIRHHDVLINVAVSFMGDLFWFIPGYRRLRSKIERLREVLADQKAIRNGASAIDLASALVRLKELSLTSGALVPYSALFRERSLLSLRVERLLQDTQERRARLGWQSKWFRIVVALWTTSAVLFTTFGGNHRTTGRAEEKQSERTK